MKTYARIQDGQVAELISTVADIKTLFNPALIWADVTGHAAVAVGWTLQPDGSFAAPMPPAAPDGEAAIVTTVASLQAQMIALQAQLATLSGKH